MRRPGTRTLYIGTSTSGWSQAGPGRFTLADGTLTSTGGMGMLWYSAEELGSYSLKLDWRLAGDDNTGVFIGFPPSSDPWSAVNNGYEIQIDATDSPDRTTGAVYGFRSADLAARDAALNPPGEWNTYELLVEGERLQVFLNGVRINDFTNTDPAAAWRRATSASRTTATATRRRSATSGSRRPAAVPGRGPGGSPVSAGSAWT